MVFKDRVQAGRMLAGRFASRPTDNLIVLAIPRGGVVVGYEVANALGVSLDVIVPRKIGAPGEPELAIGAVASWGNHEIYLDESMVRYLGVSEEYIRREADAQLAEIDRRLNAYRGNSEPPRVENADVVVVDDGIATGSTMIAAVRALKRMRPRSTVVAVPVASPDSVNRLRSEVDELIVLDAPSPFMAVGYWYQDFQQTSDEEVRSLLREAASSSIRPEL